MLFNSLQFLVFFVFVTAAYFLTPHRFQWILLLLASVYFYISFVPIYILILGFTIVVDYFAAIYIERSVGQRRKVFLICSLSANILVLIFFKYYDFLTGNASDLLNQFGFHTSFMKFSPILPIGLSFHTFQAMAYTIEVYRGSQKAERKFGIYALYIMFFPQLVAGPIERPGHLLPQFYERHSFEYQRVVDGLKLMAWGFLKKVVIADRVAVSVNTVYDDPRHYAGFALIYATLLFSIQIYCDFSGYTDIARGAAKVLGFSLQLNFKNPYFADSIRNFWHRWHISLSTWFRDYVYLPMKGSQTGLATTVISILVVFLLSALWHGAGWTFLLWGAVNGLYMVASILLFRSRSNRLTRIPRAGRIVAVFLLISFSWIFFRAASVADAGYIVTHLFSDFRYYGLFNESYLHLGAYNRLIAFFSIVLLFAVEGFQMQGSLTRRVSASHPLIRWTLYTLLILFILLFGYFDVSQQFIYFQF